MKELKFNYNWNNKLDCKAFTSLRLSNRFEIDDKVKIYLNKDIKGTAVIRGKKSFLIHQINDYIAYIDTGYHCGECQKILKNMYKNKSVNWDHQLIYFYLLEYKKEDK